MDVIRTSFRFYCAHPFHSHSRLRIFPYRLLVSLGRILSADTLAQTQYDICNSILCALNYWCHSFPSSGLLLVYKLQLADRNRYLNQEGVFSPQLFNSYRTTRLTRGFGIQKRDRRSGLFSLCDMGLLLRAVAVLRQRCGVGRRALLASRLRLGRRLRRALAEQERRSQRPRPSGTETRPTAKDRPGTLAATRQTRMPMANSA